jgi:hypothetical protein
VAGGAAICVSRRTTSGSFIDASYVEQVPLRRLTTPLLTVISMSFAATHDFRYGGRHCLQYRQCRYHTHSCKQTFGAKIPGRQHQYAAHMSAFGGKADIASTDLHVRF